MELFSWSVNRTNIWEASRSFIPLDKYLDTWSFWGFRRPSVSGWSSTRPHARAPGPRCRLENNTSWLFCVELLFTLRLLFYSSSGHWGSSCFKMFFFPHVEELSEKAFSWALNFESEGGNLGRVEASVRFFRFIQCEHKNHNWSSEAQRLSC